MVDDRLTALADYLEQNQLKLATAESCTAGLIGSILGGIPGCGKWLECGFISYSPEAKNRMLDVDYQTMETCGLTSEQVAREMAIGAIRHSHCNIAIANTGVAGPDNAEDGTPAGTVCFAWAFLTNQDSSDADENGNDHLTVFTETKLFESARQQDSESDGRNEVREQAAYYGLERIADYHGRFCAETRSSE